MQKESRSLQVVNEDDCAVLGVALFNNELDANMNLLVNVGLAGRAAEVQEVVPHVLPP